MKAQTARLTLMGIVLPVVTICNVALLAVGARLQARADANIRESQAILAKDKRTLRAILAAVNGVPVGYCEVRVQAGSLLGWTIALPECGQ